MTTKADEPPVSAMATPEFTTLTREPLSAGQPDPPEIALVGDAVRVTWPALTVEALLTHGRDHAAGITAELAITLGGVPVHWARLDLTSTSGRENVVRKLKDIDRGLPWRPILETLCYEGAKAFRASSPFICLMPRLRPEAQRFLIPKLLVRRESNVAFADGGHGKSLLGLAVGVVATGIPLPGIAPASEPVRVLYLDWESTKEEHEDRLFKLLAGAGVREAPPILYREMTRPLLEEASAVRAVISEHKIGLVIVDSLAPASGAEPESPDAAVRTLTALRSFSQTTRFALAHVSKVSAEQRSGPTRPFGSVFIQNLGRNVWEIRGAQDEDSDELRMGLYHRKVNSGRLVSHPGLRFRFDADSIQLAPMDIAQEPELVVRASLPKRILTALAGGALTVDEVAEHIGASQDSVAAKLRALRVKRAVVRLDNDEQGRGRWGLPQ